MENNELKDEKDLTPEERANRLKAVDITIDSLKQYIALSTVSIAGLLAFFNGNGKDGIKWIFVLAVVGFMLCAIVSIFTINTFINKVHNHTINVRHTGLRIPNFIAIILFLIGVLASAGFFFSVQNNDKHQDYIESKIIIENSKIEIGKDVKTKVIIFTDSVKNYKRIEVN
jgi:dipeptide/tripeptide permease